MSYIFFLQASAVPVRQPQSGLRNDRFAEDGLAGLGRAAAKEDNGEGKKEEGAGVDSAAAVDPEKLAYILIGVCCGLSVLCLVVVAISIGYRSETHYRSVPRPRPAKELESSGAFVQKSFWQPFLGAFFGFMGAL